MTQGREGLNQFALLVRNARRSFRDPEQYSFHLAGALAVEAVNKQTEVNFRSQMLTEIWARAVEADYPCICVDIRVMR